MVTLMSHQLSAWPPRRQGADTDAEDGSSATGSFPAGEALGVAGLATASTAITCMMAIIPQSPSAPPAVIQQARNNDVSFSCCYLLAISGLFYTGIAELGAAVWMIAEKPCGRLADERRLVYASLVPLTAAVGLLAAATLF